MATDYNSKYSGEQVEALLDQVASGNAGGGGGITVETDPIFSASPAASITEEEIVAWNDLAEMVDLLDKDVATLTSDVQEVQESLTDLDTIRSGAAKGATALQPEVLIEYAKKAYVDEEVKALGDSLAEIATSGSYNDLVDKPTIPSEVTESTVSGWGFTKNTGTYSKPSGGIPNSDLARDVRDALRYAEMYQGTVTSVKINGETKGSNGGVVDLGTVGTYSKPSTGIPKSDLNPSVQTSLGKADTAVQPGDLKDEVYITNFDALSLELLTGNHISSLEIDKQGLKAALAEHKVILVPYEISDNVTVKGYCALVGYYEDLLYIKVINAHSEIIIDTPLDTQYILSEEATQRNWADKQDTLVSGENVKTINGQSVLGSGNITIEGGGSSGGGKEVVLSQYIHFDDTNPVQPNKIYISSIAMTSMYIGAFQEVSNYDEYCIIFKYPEEGVYLPESVKFANGQIPTIEYDTECELSVVGIGSGANRTYHAVITPFKTL